MGDGKMRFKARFYRERQAAEGIFSDAQDARRCSFVMYRRRIYCKST